MSRAGAQLDIADDEDDPWMLPEQLQRPLPPADGGREAWLFLGSCFVFEALIWGLFRLSKL